MKLWSRVLLGLFITSALAMSAHSQSIGTDQLGAVGVVEIEIRDVDGLRIDNGVERGTGAIISSDGHVLTAGHLFSSETFAICTSAASATGGEKCSIRFYRKGLLSERFDLSIASELKDNLDYVLLKLPSPQAALSLPKWPSLDFGEVPKAQSPLTAAGYAGSLDPGYATNPLKSVTGNYSDVTAPVCTEKDRGFATVLNAQSEPGFSGGPVFDATGKIVGIVLGRGCETGLQSSSYTRWLPIDRIPNLCADVDCRYGFPGYIRPRPQNGPVRWQDRLEGDQSNADTVVHGVQLSVISKFVPPMSIACAALFSDTLAMDQVRKEAERRGELATVLLANAMLCNPSLPSSEIEANKKRLFDLADRGYEPAQVVAAALMVRDLWPKVAQAENFEYHFNERETRDLALAHKYVENAADGGWASAIYMRYYHCRMRLIQCEPRRDDLQLAADAGQLDARRELAVLHLLGSDSTGTTMPPHGFSLPRNVNMALNLLRTNAVSQGLMAGKFPYWDPTSAFYMQYLQAGGRYRGQELVPPNFSQASGYENACYSGPPLFQNPLHRMCYLFGMIARYNFAAIDSVRAQAKVAFQQDAANPDRVGMLSANIAAWLERDDSIRKVQCDLAPDFELQASPNRISMPARTANCYAPPPDPCSLEGLVGRWKCEPGNANCSRGNKDFSELYNSDAGYRWRDGRDRVHSIEVQNGIVSIYTEQNPASRYVGKLNPSCTTINWKNGDLYGYKQPN